MIREGLIGLNNFYYMKKLRWEFINERFQEKKKEDTLSIKKLTKVQENKKENTLSTEGNSKVQE